MFASLLDAHVLRCRRVTSRAAVILSVPYYNYLNTYAGDQPILSADPSGLFSLNMGVHWSMAPRIAVLIAR